MPHFGSRSKKNLEGIHPDLLKVMDEAIKCVDFTVICGYRGKAEQEEAYRTGHSKAKFGRSAHNYGLAVDCIPYPFKNEDWKDVQRFRDMAKHILQAAENVGVEVTWGGTWKMFDTPHFELSDWRNMKNWRDSV